MSVTLCNYSFWSKYWKMSIGLGIGTYRKEQKLLSDQMSFKSQEEPHSWNEDVKECRHDRWSSEWYRCSNDAFQWLCPSEPLTGKVDFPFLCKADMLNLAIWQKLLED